jgi:glutamate synthase domain-containing protein 1
MCHENTIEAVSDQLAVIDVTVGRFCSPRERQKFLAGDEFSREQYTERTISRVEALAEQGDAYVIVNSASVQFCKGEEDPDVIYEYMVYPDNSVLYLGGVANDSLPTYY